jgi:perosamine synthetase
MSVVKPPFLPYGRQWIDEDDIAAVTRVLRSDYLTTGPEIEAFEAELGAYVGARYCVAVSSATAGLHIAVAALELPAGSEGITSPNTFVASANAMVYNSVIPRFADIDPETCNIDPAAIELAVTDSTGLLIPVHFAGRACDMHSIGDIAKRHNLRVIEDAAHAIGSHYTDGSRVGSCRYSDMTVFSFHPVKTMTTGEGGAITTNDDELYHRLRMLRSHGITRDSMLMSQNPGQWYYEMQTLGFNYRMTDIQAALGRSQLTKLDRFMERRQDIVKRYHQILRDIPWLILPDTAQDEYTCFHLYVVRVDWEILGTDRQSFMNVLRENGVGSQVLYIPVHMQPYYQENFGYRSGDFPTAERYYEQALALPLFPAMSDQDQDRVIESLRGIQ